MQIIFQSLNFSDYNHTMLWAACCLGFCGFLRAGEFTVNSPFNPDIHLAVSDVQADSLVNPSSFRIHIKCSKTYPFRQGCHIYIGAGNVISALYAPLPSIYTSVAQLPAHSSFSLMSPLYIANGWHPIFNLSSPLLGSLVATPVIPFAVVQLLQQPLVAYQITSSRHLADCPAMRITSISTLPSVLSWE